MRARDCETCKGKRRLKNDCAGMEHAEGHCNNDGIGVMHGCVLAAHLHIKRMPPAAAAAASCRVVDDARHT